jgi:hypothetical protein
MTAQMPDYWKPDHFAAGDVVRYGAHQGSIVRHYQEGMWEIRLSSGVTVVSGADLKVIPKVQFEVKPVTALDSALVQRDIGAKVAPGSFVVLRTGGSGRVKIWSVHKNEKLAKAGMQRAKSREIVTR